MEVKRLKLKRFGLCASSYLLLYVYAVVATLYSLQFYFPIGLVIMSIYSYLIISRFKNIYPHPSRPSGQLCLIFLYIGFSSNFQKTKIIERVGDDIDLAHVWSFEFGMHNAISSIAGLMVIFLLIAYIYHKAMWRRKINL